MMFELLKVFEFPGARRELCRTCQYKCGWWTAFKRWYAADMYCWMPREEWLNECPPYWWEA